MPLACLMKRESESWMHLGKEMKSMLRSLLIAESSSTRAVRPRSSSLSESRFVNIDVPSSGTAVLCA